MKVDRYFHIVALIFTLSFSTVVHAQFEVCIYSKYEEGIMRATRHYDFPVRDGYQMPKLQKMMVKAMSYSPIDLSGHAGLLVKSKNKVIRSYGYYPDQTNLLINSENASKDDLKPRKMGQHLVKPKVAELCYPMKLSGVEKIEQLALKHEKKYGSWTNLHNCTRFASIIFNKLTGIKLRHGLPLPKKLYSEIINRGGKPVGEIVSPQPPNISVEMLSEDNSVEVSH